MEKNDTKPPRSKRGQLCIKLLQAPVYAYRYLLSPLLPRSCRFHPTCSAYMLEALERHGALKGLWLGIKRIGKCHPYCKCDYHDPVP